MLNQLKLILHNIHHQRLLRQLDLDPLELYLRIFLHFLMEALFFVCLFHNNICILNYNLLLYLVWHLIRFSHLIFSTFINPLRQQCIYAHLLYELFLPVLLINHIPYKRKSSFYYKNLILHLNQV